MTAMTLQQAMEAAVAHHRASRFGEAEALYRKIIAADPNYLPALVNLGSALGGLGRYADAAEILERAVRVNPDIPEAQHALAAALNSLGRAGQAIKHLRRVAELRPNDPSIHLELGIAYHDVGELDESEKSLRRAIDTSPAKGGAFNSLGLTLQRMGRIDEAIESFEAAMALGEAKAWQNRAFVAMFDPEEDSAGILEWHRKWAERFGAPLRKEIAPHGNDRSDDRPLRIGYVCADFRDHVVGRIFLPVLRRHDRGQFKVVCYSNVARPDSLTEEFKSLADVWRDIARMSDEEAAKLVRSDGIDILVDLNLHLGGSRLLLFARKPAPVQITFGYPGTTGLDTIDWRLTDPYLDPPGEFDADYSERSWRLPHSFWCYDPVAMDAPASDIAPDGSRGICFGCLNNFAKVNDGVIALWSRVLNAVPGARLLLLVPVGSARVAVAGKFTECGVEASRVEFVPHQKRSEYFASIGRIDIGLDTLPYNGHTTSLDAFWMGVPVVTLVGRTVVGRAGLSQSTNLNLTELAARTEDQFVQIATALANDSDRLAELRLGLRKRMRNSPLMDADGFARAVEAAYRGIWKMACNP